jgi:hypothetical protein
VAPFQQNSSLAQPWDKFHVVAYEEDRSPRAGNLFHPIDAASLICGIADSKDFVDQEDLGLQMGRNSECQAYVHTTRIAFHRGVQELLDLREGHDFVELALDFLPAHS